MFTKDSKEIVATLLDEGMAQHEIADFLGYSTVHISRLCSQLGINRNYNENCK
jgi:DNA-directed RNA polymerase specialized sigma subunit